MLDFIYYPISAVMWFWREVLTFLGLPEDGGFTWLAAIVLLTATVKALLVYPTVKSLRSGRQMQELSPKIQALRERYKNDKEKLAQETQKLYKESGFNPIAGCLPMLVQIPVFLGIFHVLRSFNRTGTAFNGLGMTPEENRSIGNYFFSVEDVNSFLDARIFGVPLSAFIGMPEEQYAAFEPVDFTRLNIILVAVPFIALIATFTHLNARYTLNRQKQRQASGKVSAPTGDNAEMMQMQQQMMGKMMLWVFPIITIATGFIWAIGLLSYMLTNTLWTFVQTRIVYAAMDREEEKEEQERREAAQANAPKPGARKRDKRSKKQRAADQAQQNQQAQQVDRKAAERARSQAKKKKKKKKKK
ncbi:membrane protein insertase YidC [Corynebacterium yudongzhengii]|uniref:Membrane protein insertase YidC n=1 Tax=Corynebacterium yudongzhengii TaxID=2080740 RepID=A0A2U1T4J5_9CORY|nr:membrane protein insertase YidC [Corynebacterium yudongzhengii]AWB82884.1 membrane protein insertase YidC [Corynebacterium yudongzhengii]PWC00921.1 membrane protein insertase YidC [Corynebacterium yudongzhengii]